MAANKFYFPSEAPKKSAGEQVKEWAVYMIAMVVVYYVVYYLYLAVAYPFKLVFMTDRQRFQAKLNRQRVKIQKRVEVRKAFEASGSNPLHQYLERFKLHPEIYWQDPSNDQYALWFEAMKQGKIPDTELMWAPEVYKEVSYELIINQDFMDYLEHQVSLHLSLPFNIQMRFIKTIRDYYPEFTPKFSVIPSEIQGYREEIKFSDLQAELMDTFKGKGISKKLAEELIKLAKSPEDLQIYAKTATECLLEDYCDAMILFCIKTGYDYKTADEGLVSCINKILEIGQNENIASAVIQGDLGVVEAVDILEGAIKKCKTREGAFDLVNEAFKSTMLNKCQAEIYGR